MPFTRTVDREKAIFLRKLGIPLTDIAAIMQCSPAWCYKNLQKIEKDNELINNLFSSLRKEGDGYA